MSEYQYYEFQAVDRPLTKQEMAEVRALSTRATITPTSFVNEYHWGDFKGNPLALVKSYYDAFLYLANWGTHQLMLRLPRRVLGPEITSQYCAGGDEYGGLDAELTAEHVILSFYSDTEEPEDWVEGEGWLASLVPLRADIAAGDLRSLYLGWLLCAQARALDDDSIEPPVPPGLGELSASLQTLVELLRIEDDLLEAAAERSPAATKISTSPDDAWRWLRSLSDSEKEDLLLRLASGDLLPLQAEVRRRIRESASPNGAASRSEKRRSASELLASADRKRQEREQREAQKRERQRQEQAAARAAYLDGLSGRKEAIWRQIETLIKARQQAEYAEAVRLLLDLRDLAARKQGAEGFEAQLADLRARHSRKSSFIGKLDAAGLRPAQSA